LMVMDFHNNTGMDRHYVWCVWFGELENE